MIKGYFKDREILNRFDIKRTDFGVDGVVLLKYKNKRLVWFKGHSAWNGIGNFRYQLGELVVLNIVNGEFAVITDEGRFSNKMLKDNIEKIKEVMRIEGGFELNSKKTFVIEE